MLHLDEARSNSVTALRRLLSEAPENTRAVLVNDLFGRIRVVLWTDKKDGELKGELDRALSEAAGKYWTGEIWEATEGNEADRLVYHRAWEDARDEIPEKLRLLDRHRNRGAWLRPLEEPPWEFPSHVSPKTPPVIVFYSFKGGVGRSTALAAFAARRAREGERVAVIDADLDAPGAGTLLAADTTGTIARWGVVDFLLERPHGKVDLRDYYHACRRAAVSGSGEILVIPAGQLDADYLGKLARIDMEPPAPEDGGHPFHLLLEAVRAELEPHWILVDVRAGLAEPAGMLLGGLAHLHVLFGTFSEQSWQGLRLVIERLGGDRVRDNLPQANCLVVQAMVPESTEVGKQAKAGFADRSLDEFSNHYYAEDPKGDEVIEGFWYVGDAVGSDAPHVPVAITYTPRLADYGSIDDVADELVESPDFQRLAERIAARFGAP